MTPEREPLQKLGKYEANALLAKELLTPASKHNQLGYRSDIEDPTKLTEHLLEQMEKAAAYLSKIDEPEEQPSGKQRGNHEWNEE